MCRKEKEVMDGEEEGHRTRRFLELGGTVCGPVTTRDFIKRQEDLARHAEACDERP